MKCTITMWEQIIQGFASKDRVLVVQVRNITLYCVSEPSSLRSYPTYYCIHIYYIHTYIHTYVYIHHTCPSAIFYFKLICHWATWCSRIKIHIKTYSTAYIFLIIYVQKSTQYLLLCRWTDKHAFRFIILVQI